MYQTFDIILGDFNIDAVQPNAPVLQVLNNYAQVVAEYSQISSGLLDHVFIYKDIAEESDIQNIVITTHFIDPDAVFFLLQMKNNERYVFFIQHIIFFIVQ